MCGDVLRMTATERQNWVWIQHLRLQSPHASCLRPGAGTLSTLLSCHDEISTRKQDPEPDLGLRGGATALLSGSLLGCVLACDGAKQSTATPQAGRRSLSLITGSRTDSPRNATLGQSHRSVHGNSTKSPQERAWR